MFETHTLTRRDFLRLSAAAATGAVVAACAPAAPQIIEVEKEVPVKEVVVQTVEVEKEVVVEAEKPAQLAEVIWFGYGSGVDKQSAEAILDQFHELHPEISVTRNMTVGNYYEVMQTTLASGVKTDMLNYQTWRWQPYAARGVLAALDDYRESDDWHVPWPEEWETLYDAQTVYRGKCYASPYNMGSMVIFYVKEEFERKGVPYPDRSWTLDDFKEIARQLTYEEGGVKHYGYQTNDFYERLACWMRLDGDKEWDNEVEPREAHWDQESIMDALNWQIYEAINTEGVSPTPMMDGYYHQVAVGNIAMKMEGPWFLHSMQGPDAQREGGTEFDVVMMPKGATGEPKHMAFGHTLCMHADSKVPDATWEVIKYTGGEEAQRWIAEFGRQPVTPEFNRKFWAPIAQEKFFFENTDDMIDAFETGIVHMCGGVGDIYIQNEVVNSMLEKMVVGEADAYEVVPPANEEIQAILDDWWAENA
jgi:multiple sugar transport system substrate-binding protein